MPGHTWWALGLVGEVDGTRVAFTGDNLLAGALSPLRAAAPITATGCARLDRRRRAAAHGVRARAALTGHTGALPVTRRILDDFLAWAKNLEGVSRSWWRCSDEVNFALDPHFATIFPYRTQAQDRASSSVWSFA